MITPEDFRAIRSAIAAIPGDVSNDAVGAHVAKIDDLFAPESHAVALDPTTPIVIGTRGSGKSFWSSVLGQVDTCLLYTSPSPRDRQKSRMPSSA